MSPINGFDLYERFTKIDRNLKALFLSADSSHYAEYKKQYPASDSRQFMRKPVGITDLGRQVESMVRLSSFDQKAIPGRILKKALDESLDMLGSATKEAVLEDLERSGLFLDTDTYSIEQIHKYFDSLFGTDASGLLIERFRKAMEKLD
jgi:hypothetical protein